MYKHHLQPVPGHVGTTHTTHKHIYTYTAPHYSISLLRMTKRKYNREAQKKKRPERGQSTITVDGIIKRILLQGGRCYYSGIPMSFKPNTDWLFSIDRINTHLNYTEDNCNIICWEFNSSVSKNGKSNWNQEKSNQFLAFLQTQNNA